MSEQTWPWRARFAHWVVGLLADWLMMAPDDEDALLEEEARRVAQEDAAYLAGREDGYRDAYDDTRGDVEWA